MKGGTQGLADSSFHIVLGLATRRFRISDRSPSLSRNAYHARVMLTCCGRCEMPGDAVSRRRARPTAGSARHPRPLSARLYSQNRFRVGRPRSTPYSYDC